MTQIRELRKAKGLTISKLSHAAGVNASVISWAELGKLPASRAVREALSKYYDRKEENLFQENGFAI